MPLVSDWNLTPFIITSEHCLLYVFLTVIGDDTTSSIGVGELEITPVSAAIARHLGIDLTPEGKAARNRRGLAIIVHGAPMSGNEEHLGVKSEHSLDLN